MRVGKCTASRIADVVARTKTGWGASRANYAAELIAERLTGLPHEGYVSAAMKHGTETEPDAIAAYEFLMNLEIERASFVDHPRIPQSGASPDGYVGDDGLVETKCPTTATHLATLLGTPISDSYIKQMQWQMGTTGRQWCDWVSFEPRLPEEMRLFVQRVFRDDKMIAVLENEVTAFLAEIDEKVATLRAKYMRQAA
jgi:predicted phage-related endonuclease